MAVGIQQRRGGGAKGKCQLLQIIDTGTDFPAFYCADIGSVQPAPLCQLFLAPAVQQAEQPQVQ